ncbi:sulfate transport system ATP-binding protein [Cellulosimicrobium cellulans J34]|nr:sulfate transport system ATP-binding protein [Cellulosimicrobium cellulans J34]
MSIEIRNVRKTFGDFVALDDVSVSVPTGRLTALLGPSGGGKSTLLRVVAGLEVPDSGAIEIEGRDATNLPARRRNVGFVFQHYAAFKHLSVARNVAFGLEIRRTPKAEIAERVDELLRLVHLESFAHRLPSQLSGGQRQRMALARALAIRPSVLLLDEPFGALDAKVRKELRDWLRRLHDEIPVTTVFVTHDQEEALEVADEIVVVNEGRIEQVGTPDDLYDRPANDFVMGFLGPVTRLGGVLVRPHDVHVEVLPGVPAPDDASSRPGGPVTGVVTRTTRVGFEVRAEVSAGDEVVSVVVTRAEARTLGLAAGVAVRLAPAQGAPTACPDAPGRSPSRRPPRPDPRATSRSPILPRCLPRAPTARPATATAARGTGASATPTASSSSCPARAWRCATGSRPRAGRSSRAPSSGSCSSSGPRSSGRRSCRRGSTRPTRPCARRSAGGS